jgi:histidinol dehydrogenase/sulfopropanediol 3-dehydrogenase
MPETGDHLVLKQGGDASAEIATEVRDSVYDIVGRVREGGDEAVLDLTEQFDGVEVDRLRVPDTAVEAAAEELDAGEKEAIDTMVERVREFAVAQKEALVDDFEQEFGEGVRCGHRTLPVEAAGTYVPSGNFTHVATAPMAVVPAVVAGVDRVVTCTPPGDDGSVNPYRLYAVAASGADEIYTVGGAQAVAAMAHGTETVNPVDVVAGPGNVFVVEAKRQVFGQVGIDLLGGPTEVLIVADGTADPHVVAVDLLSQAEHTESSQAVLVSTDRELAEATMAEVESVLPDLRTEETARACWEQHGEVVVADDHEAAAALANEYAMEHLQVMTREPREMVDDLQNYGSLFLGANAPVVFGDKITGPDHILPTHTTARFSGGCNVGSYVKTVTHQELTPGGAARLADDAATISEIEGMDGHRRSAELRPVDEE